MKDARPPEFGIRAIRNLMIGRGTFIKAPGYKGPIETEANAQIGDGTFIDTSDEPEEPKDGQSGRGGNRRRGTAKDIIVGVAIAVISAAVLSSAGLLWESVF